MAAYALANAKCALGAFYRRLRARLGAPKAITATAHKLARIFYRMLTTKTPFRDTGQDYYEQQYRQRLTRSLEKKAATLGFRLIPNPETSTTSTHFHQAPKTKQSRARASKTGAPTLACFIAPPLAMKADGRSAEWRGGKWCVSTVGDGWGAGV